MSDEIRIFISYAREDQPRVQELYDLLVDAGYYPWLDREHIHPGQRWEPIIKSALKKSHFVLVCLSATSINKRGFLQKEIKQALEQAQEKLEDDVWLIPARLDDCDVPDALAQIQWVDLFDDDGFRLLLAAMEYQLKKENIPPPSAQPKQKPKPASPPAIKPPEPLIISQPLVQRMLQSHQAVIEQPNRFSITLAKGMSIEMVNLTGGEFTMGGDRFDWEQPRHQVTVSPFAIGQYQVTQAQWRAVMGDNPSQFQGYNLPVENVSYEDIQSFLKKLGTAFRLPTEAEWEYAARAGTDTEYCFGDDEKLLGEYAWFSENSDSKTHPVGLLKPNQFGLYDIHGNVWEWCSDWYGSGYYAECQQKGVVADPQGPRAGASRVIRGGSWVNGAVGCRSADRDYGAPGLRSDSLGFRLVGSAGNP
ncbi:MAG: SUMF1/EgtB/PvdO family nonheme iron enzyme [Acidobacteria bacterium]|nr:SUMF1/EgtB/PvdO family nonheme iron enzyme [Acidobacteriota bacterium]